MPDAPIAAPPARLIAQGLGQRVGERVLFSGVDVEVRAGAPVRVTGASGSGKTSLLRLLAWLDAPTAGTLTLDGQPPEQWGAPVWRSRVALVAQEPARLPESPADTVGWMRGLRHGRLLDDPVALASAWMLPAHRWAQPWAALSGGEAQRVALALALGRRPDVLLLDEPTSALDDAATAAVVASLRGRALVLVSHDPRLVDALPARTVAL